MERVDTSCIMRRCASGRADERASGQDQERARRMMMHTREGETLPFPDSPARFNVIPVPSTL